MEHKRKELHRIPIRKLVASIKKDLKQGLRPVALGNPKKK
jgi:hypothetical protein